ncbi:MgtC/SapB family protein [Porphyromonas sp. COT-108 OH2963]|uniref:MgtC/SapB family protein n=1 Tax=Porphyromonas sp. COT-108 OH2963 TaxID=1515614 RepID=UPI0006908331|nr:MgtC/SapB family protein [Porphyromonas sp. COT-108 OH2963]
MSFSEFFDLSCIYHGGLQPVDVVVRLLYSVVVGMLIGYNRQVRYQRAGLRTFTLITVGSTVAMLISIYLPDISGMGDPARIAAQVLSGVGFLGAGAILRGRGDNVQGLTTAAGIWVCSALGLAIGAGMYMTSAIVTLLVLFVLVVMGYVEEKLGLRQKNLGINVDTTTALPNINAIKGVLSSMKVSVSNVSLDSNFKNDTGHIYIEAKSSGDKVSYEVNKALGELDFVSSVKTNTY